MTKSEKDVETIRGDGLWLTMDSNKKLLEIMGDGCKITLVKNYGTIRINGDGCRLKVIQNLGSIEYNGDGGRVDLGPDSNKDKVTFCGHGGHVNFSRKELDISNLKENSKQGNSDVEDDNRANERREKRRNFEFNTKRGCTVIVKNIVSTNGECKKNVKTSHKKN